MCVDSAQGILIEFTLPDREPGLGNMPLQPLAVWDCPNALNEITITEAIKLLSALACVRYH